MVTVMRSTSVILVTLLISGCAFPVKPLVSDLELESAEHLSLDNLILTERVTLERGTKRQTIYASEKTVPAIATSKFGAENEVANVTCIVAGLRHGLNNLSIIPPKEFWSVVGSDNAKLHLTSLFDKPNSLAIEKLSLDFLVASYHQHIDEESYFMEALVEGGMTNKDREIAATVTVDMENRRVIGAAEVNARHSTIMGHIFVVLPFGVHEYPEEEPCALAGMHAAKAISQSLTTNKALRVAVVVAESNPYKAVSSTAESVIGGRSIFAGVSEAELLTKAQMGEAAKSGDPEALLQLYFNNVTKQPTEAHRWLCQSADHGHPDARYRLALLYEHGQEGFEKNYVKAYVWYVLAAQSGSYWGKQHAKRLRAENLDPELISAAEDAVKEWQPGQCQNGLKLPNNR